MMNATSPPKNNSKALLEALLPDVRKRIIVMAWEEQEPFEAIFKQFGLHEHDVRYLMRRSMKNSSFQIWSERLRSRTAKDKTLPAEEATPATITAESPTSAIPIQSEEGDNRTFFRSRRQK